MARAYPKRVRIRNVRLIARTRKPYCQVCGARHGLQVHHCRTRGAGGDDVPANLVTLCYRCHRMVHDGNMVLDRDRLIDLEVPGVEELIQRGIDCLQSESESKWVLGAVCQVGLTLLGLKAGELGAYFGCTAAYVRELARTWRTFPAEELRVPELSWQHHRIAARAPDPLAFLHRAADMGWSTREMQAALRTGPEPSEEEAAMERARRALNLVRNVLAMPGPGAEWLRGHLLELLDRRAVAAAS